MFDRPMIEWSRWGIGAREEAFFRCEAVACIIKERRRCFLPLLRRGRTTLHVCYGAFLCSVPTGSRAFPLSKGYTANSKEWISGNETCPPELRTSSTSHA